MPEYVEDTTTDLNVSEYDYSNTSKLLVFDNMGIIFNVQENTYTVNYTYTTKVLDMSKTCTIKVYVQE